MKCLLCVGRLLHNYFGSECRQNLDLHFNPIITDFGTFVLSPPFEKKYPTNSHVNFQKDIKAVESSRGN